MTSPPVVPSNPKNIVLALAGCETLAQQLAVARHCQSLIASAPAAAASSSGRKKPKTTLSPVIHAFADWGHVWDAEAAAAKAEQRPMRLTLWHFARAESSEGVPMPFALEDGALQDLAEIYGEIPSGLKTTLIAPLVRALHEARLPLYEIEGRAFTVHVTSSEKTKSVVPWYEIVTERAAQIKKDSTPDEEQPAADEEKPKGSKSIKESTKKAAGTVKDVGKKISDKVKGEKAKLSDGERLASRSKRPAPDTNLVRSVPTASVAPLPVTGGQGCSDCTNWKIMCPNEVWDKDGPCRNVSVLGPGFLGSDDESWMFARLSFVLLDSPDAVRLDLECAINRHTGAITPHFDDETTTHIVVFQSWKEASTHPDVVAAQRAGRKTRGGELLAPVRIVHVSFVLESIRRRARAQWENHNVNSMIISPLWNWFGDASAGAD